MAEVEEVHGSDNEKEPKLDEFGEEVRKSRGATFVYDHEQIMRSRAQYKRYMQRKKKRAADAGHDSDIHNAPCVGPYPDDLDEESE